MIVKCSQCEYVIHLSDDYVRIPHTQIHVKACPLAVYICDFCRKVPAKLRKARKLMDLAFQQVCDTLPERSFVAEED